MPESKSGDTPHFEVHAHGWTFDTLSAYLLSVIEANDKRYKERFEFQATAVDTAFAAQQLSMQTAFNAQKEAMQTALAAADRAVAKAETASEKRFDAVNEFRATLGDQQRTLMPRAEAEVKFSSQAAQISDLKEQIVARTSRETGQGEGWKWAVGIVALVAAVLSAVAVTSAIMRM